MKCWRAAALGLLAFTSMQICYTLPIGQQKESINFSALIPECAFSEVERGYLAYGIQSVDQLQHLSSDVEGGHPALVSFSFNSKGAKSSCIVVVGLPYFVHVPDGFVASHYTSMVTGSVTGANATPAFYPVKKGDIDGMGYRAEHSGMDSISVNLDVRANSHTIGFPQGFYTVNVSLTAYR